MFGDYVRWCWISYFQPNPQDRAIALIYLAKALYVSQRVFQEEISLNDLYNLFLK